MGGKEEGRLEKKKEREVEEGNVEGKIELIFPCMVF